MIEFVASCRGKLFIVISRIFRKNILVGKGLKIYKKLSVQGKGKITIGDNCIIDGIVGDNSQSVVIGVQSQKASITIGNNAKLYAARISAKFNIEIGDDILVEESGITDTDYHSIDIKRDLPNDETYDNCKIRIGNQVCIGSRSFITKGVTIGDNVIVWPCSVVMKSIKSNMSVCGNPAKFIRT